MTCAVSSGGALKCWGRNQAGALGLGDREDRGDEFGELGEGLPAIDLGSGRRALGVVLQGINSGSCALLDDGAAKCWGDRFSGVVTGPNNNRGDEPGQMGDNLPALRFGTGRRATNLAASWHHACVLLDDGSVKCWGYNSVGNLGLGDTENRYPEGTGDELPAVALGGGRRATRIASGVLRTCALLDDGSLKCWGRNIFGELGLGDTANRGDDPVEMGDNLPVVDLGAGRHARSFAVGGVSCAILDDDSLKCWGANGYAGLGLGDLETRGDEPGEMGDNLPVIDLGTEHRARAVAAGLQHVCALLDDASVKCWGDNEYGQLGLGDTEDRGDEPGEMGDALPAVSLGTGRRATGITAGDFHTCALLDDGSVKCWGWNDYGQLGLGDTENRGDEPGEMGDALPAVELGF
jgi:alpha-tubulin suppressor-like RCC1 family protein